MVPRETVLFSLESWDFISGGRDEVEGNIRTIQSYLTPLQKLRDCISNIIGGEPLTNN